MGGVWEVSSRHPLSGHLSGEEMWKERQKEEGYNGHKLQSRQNIGTEKGTQKLTLCKQ